MNRFERRGSPGRGLAAVCVLLLPLAGASLVPQEAAAASSGACAKAVQGKIPWDHKGSKRWRRVRILKLCKGAMHSTQPARCFKTVMYSGKVNWGGGTRWQPRNAVNLCRGTVDARARIGCFQHAISKGRSWQSAIRKCRSVAAGKRTDRTSASDDGETRRYQVDPDVAAAVVERARKAERCEHPDKDGDGHAARECGGDDCDDSDRERYPGNVEVCDARGHDEDCDPSTLAGGVSGSFRPAGMPAEGDRDGDGLISEQCCNQQSDGALKCGLDPGDRNSALRPGAQVCLGDQRMEVIASRKVERCRGRCVTQPNGTGVCVPTR